jgi:hypothetical protein
LPIVTISMAQAPFIIGLIPMPQLYTRTAQRDT